MHSVLVWKDTSTQFNCAQFYHEKTLRKKKRGKNCMKRAETKFMDE